MRLSSDFPHAYGNQIQNRAIPNATPEASVQVEWEEFTVVLGDGTEVSLRKPNITLANLAYGALPADTKMSARLAAPVYGLGLLEAVTESTLLEWADRSSKLT